MMLNMFSSAYFAIYLSYDPINYSFFLNLKINTSTFPYKDMDPCYGLHCVPPNSYVEALTPSVTVFGDRAYQEVRRVEEIIWVGP